MSDYAMMSQDYFESLRPHEKTLLALERQFDYDYAVTESYLDYLIGKQELAYKEADLRVLVEGGSYDMLDDLYMEASEKSSGGIVGALKSLCDKIIKFFKDTFNMIREKVSKVFKGKSKLTADEFEGSDQWNLMVNTDYNKRISEIESKMSEGERLLRRAASTTGIPQAQLDGYCRSAKKLCDNIPTIVCKAAKGAAVAGGFVILYKNYGTIVEKLGKTVDRARKLMTSTKDNIKGAHPQEEKEIVDTMGGLSKKLNEITSKISIGAAGVAKTIKGGIEYRKTGEIKNPALVNDLVRTVGAEYARGVGEPTKKERLMNQASLKKFDAEMKLDEIKSRFNSIKRKINSIKHPVELTDNQKWYMNAINNYYKTAAENPGTKIATNATKKAEKLLDEYIATYTK